MAHPNARLTPATRLELVLEVEAGWSQAEVARRFRVSRATVAKWWRRYREEGAAGLRDRSSAPRSNPHRTAAALAAHLRRAPQPGVRAAPHRLGARDRPLHRLRRAQALRSTASTPREQAHAALRAPRPRRPAAYRREEAGPHRRRRAPRARPLRRAPRTRGLDYLHVAVDDHSRYAYVAVLPDCELRRLSRAGARCSAGVACACAACSPTTRRPTPSPATSAAWPRPLAWHWAHPALPPADERQGRALHPDPAERVGLRPPLPLQRRAAARAPALALPLQCSPATRRYRRGCPRLTPVNNVRGNYT